MPVVSGAEVPPTRQKTYVIVHGAWGGGWTFRQVEDLLRMQGHRVYRPTLTGLGERVHLATREVGLRTHVADVVNILLFENLKEVILVGHSYGGMVISGVADRVPERIRRLVYLDAFVPEDGESVMTIPPFAERSGWLKSMTRDGFIVPAWAKPELPFPKDVPQPEKTFTEPVSLKNPAARKLPATYILTLEPGAQTDDFMPFAERAKARGWTVLQMTADHNPQQSAPEAGSPPPSRHPHQSQLFPVERKGESVGGDGFVLPRQPNLCQPIGLSRLLFGCPQLEP
jgi:pimeloyl-ACP methyl ester carboxylesterase